MKGVIILAVLLAMVGAGLYCGVMKEAMSDQGIWLLTAIGNLNEKNVEMVVSVELGATVRARPKVDSQMNPLWDEWIAEHYELTDDAGKVQPFTRIAHSLLVDERKVKTLSEFYVRYVLEKGRGYSLEYKPKRDKKGHYRHTFTAPSDTTPPERVHFLPVTN